MSTRNKTNGISSLLSSVFAPPRPPKPEPYGPYGNARWMRHGEAQSSPYGFPCHQVPPRVPNIGLFMNMETRDGAEPSLLEMGLPGEGHLITIAPTRSGKGVTQVIPALLECDLPMVVLDIKGENYARTARTRARRFGDVYRICPTDPKRSVRFNPMDMVIAGEDGYETALLLADMLIVPNEKAGGTDDYWEREAKSLLTALIQFVANEKDFEERTLTTVWKILTSGQVERTLEEIAKLGDMSGAPRARAMLQKSENEFKSVVSSAQNAMSVFGSPAVQRVTSSSDVHPWELRDPDRSVTFYLVIPPEQLTTLKPFTRLMVGLITNFLTQTKGISPKPTLMLLDEFPSLGYMPKISEGLAYLAGYDVKLWLFCQDIGQLRRIYGDGTTSILSNCAVRNLFTPNDWETAQLISQMTGTQTVPTWSADPRANGWTVSTSQTGSPLLRPEEVMQLAKFECISFFTGLPPARIALWPVFDRPHLVPLTDDWTGDCTLPPQMPEPPKEEPEAEPDKHEAAAETPEPKTDETEPPTSEHDEKPEEPPKPEEPKVVPLKPKAAVQPPRFD